VVIKGLRSIILVKSVVIIYIINLQYILIVRVVNVNCRCGGYKVQYGGSGTFFLFFFHLFLYTLLFLNFFLKLK